MENLTWFKRQLHGTNILLIEDNHANQLLVTELLKQVGANLDCLDNGQLALHKVASETYDIVIMDINMPIMDGYETTRQIRNNPQLTQLPIIAMTANATKEDRKHCLDVGMNDFLAKPIKPDQMYSMLAKWLPVRNFSQKFYTQKRNSATMEYKTNPTIDLSIIKNVLHHDTGMIRKFTSKFLEVTEHGITVMKAASDNKDLKSMGEQGHKLRSSAQTMGAFHFADLCEKLENAANTNNTQLAEQLCDEIIQSFQHVKQQLEREFSNKN